MDLAKEVHMKVRRWEFSWGLPFARPQRRRRPRFSLRLFQKGQNEQFGSLVAKIVYGDAVLHQSLKSSCLHDPRMGAVKSLVNYNVIRIFFLTHSEGCADTYKFKSMYGL